MQTIQLTQGEETFVDDTDYKELKKHKWYAKNSASMIYAARSIHTNGSCETVYMARHLLDCPKDLEVDHINENTLDNQRHNLQIVTHIENLRLKHERRSKK